MNENSANQMIITMLAEGNPVWYVAAMVNMRSHDVYLIGQAAGNLGLLMLIVFVAGTLMNTAQSSLPALAAGFYPTQGRATGVAWMLGLGRFGGIAGSFLVAELARRQLGFSAIFTVVAVPGLIAAAALIVKQLARPEGRTVRVAAGSEALGH